MIKNLSAQEPIEIILQLGVVVLSFVFGLIISKGLKKALHFKSKINQSIFHKTQFSFFFFSLVVQGVAALILTFALGSSPHLLLLVIYLQMGFTFTSLLKGCFQSSAIRVIGGIIIWTAIALQVFDFLEPFLSYLQSVSFQVGSIRITLLGLIKALLSTVFLIYGANAFSNYISKRLNQKKHLQRSMQLLVSKIVKTLLIICSVFFGFSLLGIDLSVFSIFAGALGVGVAFSLQNIFSNYFSGFIILMDRSIKPGDVISLDGGKICGIVNKLQARYISIRTREGKEHLIPNQMVITNKLENWSYSDPSIRMEIRFKVSYDSDISLTGELLVAIAKETARVKKDPAPYVRFSALIDNAVELKLRVWVEDPENGTSGIQSDIVFEAWKAFKKHKIQVPYPPREIHTKSS
ncbi:MAG: mechanosensitive ion channel [Chlamydiia bacterium]|nr:mechanosensitive ion channel [Chlamydiia bacterium]